MSGRSLFPLTIEMCHRICPRSSSGKMRISFAGGADVFNCDKLFAAGIWPITVATTILKPGGYNRLHPDRSRRWSQLDLPSLLRHGHRWPSAHLSAASHSRICHHSKPIKPLPSRKMREKVPLAGLLHRPLPGRLPHPSRTFPSIWSCAARACTPRP